MKYVTAAALAVGIALLGVIVLQTDLAVVWQRLLEIGWWGVAVILFVRFFAYLAESISWHLTLPSVRLDVGWGYKLWKVLMVGEALNDVTPLGSLGGEPIKAALLKRHYGIGYRESTASQLLKQTVNTIGMVLFMLIGMLLMLETGSLPLEYQITAGVGFAIFSCAILIFFLAQRYRILSRTGGWLNHRRLGTRTHALLDVLHDVEDRLVVFYTCHRWRLALAILFSVAIWWLGAVEIYIVLAFLGHAVSFADAWVIEAVALLVRAALFFVPAAIGAQEGTFLLVCGAMTGSPAIGLALAVVRRLREVAWIGLGLALGWFFSPRRA